ncbi:hypothetical protein JCGZ_00974 [Jatropha curcas]|uniref:Phosphoribosylglycinamide formyltransferase, chloroplastic n=1 Tax=Jatropha curcas TaxID=180498 RepID=A0A067KSY7_JATCU|nr:hypothetical protein JCGZ_00974 [Jatropha curcas]
MESKALLSGLCSNSTFPAIQNNKKPLSLTFYYSSYSYSSGQSQNYVSFNTHQSISPPRVKSLSFKRLECANSSEKLGSTGFHNEGYLNSGIKRKKLAVFVSGGGSNFKSVHEACIQGSVHGDVVAVVTNRKGCGGAEYARNKEIPVVLFPRTKDEPDGLSPRDLVAALREFEVDFILLAGYLKLIPAELVQAYPKRILNIHPALLPAFGGKGYYGMKVHKAVIASGARYSGPTIHFVDEHYDTGLIIAQRVVPVLANDTAEELAARVLREEHRLYVEVTAALCEERIIWREDGVPLIRSRENPNQYS